MSRTSLGHAGIFVAGAWSDASAYGKLSIVTNGGNAYIAKTDVPAGMALTNTDYWIQLVEKGDKGNTGEISGASASISGGYGTPAVSVTSGGTSTDRSFAFAFSNLVGNGITGITLEKTDTEGLVDTYTMTITTDAGDETVTFDVTNGQDGEVTEESLAETLEDYAKIDGAYETMTVGNSEQLVSTVNIEDQTPYNFRTSGGSVDIGDREEDTIVGGTVAWNQLIQNGNFANTTGISAYAGTIAVSNNTLAFTVTDVSGSIAPQIRYSRRDFIVGHKYFFTFKLKPAHSLSSKTFCYLLRDSGSVNYIIGGSCDVTENVWNNIDKIVYINPTTASGSTYGTIQFAFCMTSANGYAVNDISYLKDLMFIDLTQMFGSTIADYIYSIEQANEGDGVAWFKKLFPKPYYAYNAGGLMSVNTSAHQMTMFNQFDKSIAVRGERFSATGTETVLNTYTRSDYIKCIPGSVYYFKNVVTTVSSYSAVFWYDAQKNYISANSIGGTTDTHGDMTATAPQNAYYMGINLLTADIDTCCANLRWDGERDGEYEEYKLRSYPLDSSLTLRGIPKLDANNNLYYDGDVYESDGTVTRKYGIVDLGTLSWSYSDGAFSVTRPSDSKAGVSANIGSIICEKYVASSRNGQQDKTISITPSYLFVLDSAYTDAPTFTTAMSGVYLVYELDTPTTEQADPYQSPQIVDDFGTEEYVDYAESQGTRDVAIPVGHVTQYQPNLRAKLEMAPNSPDGDGDYIVRQTNGTNEYVQLVIPDELPDSPTEDGTYVLKATVSSGTATLSWEAQS